MLMTRFIKHTPYTLRCGKRKRPNAYMNGIGHLRRVSIFLKIHETNQQLWQGGLCDTRKRAEHEAHVRKW